MKQHVPLFEKFAGTHLLIVDVQENFAKWWEDNNLPFLPDDIMEYAKGFDYVYQIWDAIDVNEPSYHFPNEIRTIEKTYGGDIMEEDAADYFEEPELGRFLKDWDNAELEDNVYTTKDGGGVFYIAGVHEWFIASSELIELFEELRNSEADLIVVGGAEGECLTDITTALDTMDIPYEVNRDYTYRA